MASRERVLVVSIDGVAARAISPGLTPTICSLARAGAGCFDAQTVEPPITLPAHASMLYGVEPEQHGITTNRHVPPPIGVPSFLAAARASALTTAAVLSWRPIDALIEPDALDHRSLHGDGENVADDVHVARAARNLLRHGTADVTFVYLASPDIVGHEEGWDSPPYRRAVARADSMLHDLVDAAPNDTAVVVTTDHGGTQRGHYEAIPDVMDTFVVVRSAQIDPGSRWPRISITDIAPTVADLADFEPDDAWTGTSLIGRETPTLDWLVGLLERLRSEAYGERIDILDHSLQTAALARERGASDHLVAASLLHDVGHVLGDASEWGVHDHAELAARALQPWLPAAVVEPVRLHVEAKRWLVSVDPGYHDRLSLASQHSLAEQGGPLDEVAAKAFANEAYADDAARLRRWDDEGKIAGGASGRIDRGLLARLLADPGPVDDVHALSPAWARRACRCEECRDPVTGQHVLSITDLSGWTVVSARRSGAGLHVLVEGAAGEQHRCWIPDQTDATTTLPSTLSGPGNPPTLAPRSTATDDDLAALLAEMIEHGIALGSGVDPTPGEVLSFARRIGFVRETNYGELFDVVADPTPTNLASTPRGLSLHTDNPYRDPVPTVQILHCIRQARSGGASRFADGLAAAERLRATSPHDFDTLATTPQTFRFRTATDDLRATTPVISVGRTGRIERITLNDRSMETPDDRGDAGDFYGAWRAFVELLESPDHSVEFTLQPGQVVLFDNRRIVHGRGAFPPDGDRHLQGTYIDIDEVHSRARVRGR